MLLSLMAAQLGLTDQQVREEICAAHDVVVDVLARKGVAYADLRNGLVPRRDRLEVAFLFDSAQITSAFYGVDVAKHLVPLLPKDLTCGILAGDLIMEDQDLAFRLLSEEVVLHRSVEVRHTTQLFCVYLNNLTPTMRDSLVGGLRQYEPFVGYAETSTSSALKDWLSMTVGTAYFKAGSVVLNGHEDDVSDDEDYNMKSWPWADSGYFCRSFRDAYFHLFLSFKIERRVLPAETDTRFSLLAISDEPMSLPEMQVEVSEEKMRYLRTSKQGSLERAGLSHLTDEELARVIGDRLTQSYIYELGYRDEYNLSQFNLMLEIPTADRPARLMAAMQYQPDEARLRLLTLY
jgi:hypothetical protein